MAAKDVQKRKATCRNYTIGKIAIRVGDILVQIAEKEAQKAKRAPKMLVIEVDSEEDDNMDLDSEMEGFAFGADMAGVPDTMSLSYDYTKGAMLMRQCGEPFLARRLQLPHVKN
jgi:hypothetical protein